MKLAIVLFFGVIASCSGGKEIRTNVGSYDKSYSKVSFLPENNLNEQDNAYNSTGITEDEFNEVLDAIEQIYTPIFQSFGAKLVVNRFWSDTTVNAYAEQSGEFWTISMFGGLARREEITKEGFALVACHEIGHHLGGYPFYTGEWASNEGNSDFYSTASCARMIFSDSSQCSFLPTNTPDEISCGAYGQNKTICQRSLAGGLSLGKLLARLNNEKVPSYSTPDMTVVKKTSDTHPKAQCRVDTYKAGAVCSKEWNNKVIPMTGAEMKQNSCAARPKCWFAK